MRSRKTRLWVCLPAFAMAVAWGVAGSTPAVSAEPDCAIRESSPQGDWGGMAWPIDLYCANTPGDVTSQSFTGSPVTGRMTKTKSWFVCWKIGAPHAGKNSVWYYTKGDEVVNNPGQQAWGYMPANALGTTKAPFPGLRKCTWG
ncbi:hypothetical protein ACFRJ1_16210 [Streptomyces sp. NPDC056773]|uniref:hypothetical protein n=1 Tax=unclassified Streptomyces TaxID=2593676 RepID=UPI00369C3AAB